MSTLQNNTGSCHVYQNGDQGDHEHGPQPKGPIAEFLFILTADKDDFIEGQKIYLHAISKANMTKQ